MEGRKSNIRIILHSHWHWYGATSTPVLWVTVMPFGAKCYPVTSRAVGVLEGPYKTRDRVASGVSSTVITVCRVRMVPHPAQWGEEA